MTTRYQVEYFLNDVELGSGKNDAADDANPWQNANYYSTFGTEDAFAAQSANADYQIAIDNDLHALMDGSIGDDSVFVDDAIQRGEYSEFAYHINKRPHVFTLPELPAAPEGETLTATYWVMKDAKGNVLAKIDPLSDFTVRAENVSQAWLDTVDDDVDTYHLYVYSAKEPVTPTPGNPGGETPTPSQPAETVTFIHTGDFMMGIVVVLGALLVVSAAIGAYSYRKRHY